MRLFLAFALPLGIERALRALRRDMTGWRWVEDENLHLTLAFLGDVERHDAEELDAALAALTIEPPEITLSGIGHFGSRQPRAVWVGARPVAGLTTLSERLVRTARQTGIAVERRKFIPHVTLARLNAAASQADVAQFSGQHGALSLQPFTPSSVTLFRSHLRPEGPIYEALADYPDAWP